MLQIPLDELKEEDLRQLCEDRIPEGVRLEFKRELHLDSRTQKLEVAKDVSSFANTAGGRIIYGIEEETSSEGESVAATLSPLTDDSLLARLVNVIVTVIQPKPRFFARSVPSANGFCIVVDVRPSSGLDLYMVSGYSEKRFYRRGAERAVPMEEPEIREAYRRIAVTSIQLDAKMERETREELDTRANAEVSIVIVPWFGRPNLADPRALQQIKHDLATKALRSLDSDRVVSDMRPYVDGFRGVRHISADPHSTPPEKAYEYIVIRRSGLFHYSLLRVSGQGQFNEREWHIQRSLRCIAGSVLGARAVYEHLGYWGPARLHHRLRFTDQVWFGEPGDYMHLEPGIYDHCFPELDLQMPIASIETELLQEIMDQVWQAAGMARCSLFDSSGKIVNQYRGGLPEELR